MKEKWIHIDKDFFKDIEMKIKVDVTTAKYCDCDECEEDKIKQMTALKKEFLNPPKNTK